MASSDSPPPSSMATPPSSSPPPPSSTQPPIAQPNATSDPPSSVPPPSTPNTPPPSLSTPNAPPPTIMTPPPIPNSPPPTPSDPPPPTSNDPPPPSPPTSSPLPPRSAPTTPTLPPPSTPSPPPPTPISTPSPQSPPKLPTPSPVPPTKSPPSISAPPPSPPFTTPPPPPSTTPPPVLSPPSPIPISPPKSQDPPSNHSTPPPKEQPPNVPSTPPPREQPPNVPSTPPPREQPPNVPSTPPPREQPPNVPSNPLVPPSPVSSDSPLPSPNNPSNDPIVSNPNGNKSSTFGPNVTAGVNGSNGGGGGSKIAVPVAIVASLFVLSLIGLAVWYVRRRKKRNGGYSAGFVMPSPLISSQISGSSYPQSPSAPVVYTRSGSQNLMNRSHSNPGLGNSKACFSYEELHNATNGFSEENLLGEGGFGCVYKGCLSDGREVAVKQLKVGGSQGEREFRAEVEIIGRVHHRHLVSLVGYCIADPQRLLVYDYVPNDTLHHHLHGEGRPVMKWEVRLKVAAGAARGIAYLHEDCHPRIIHRDIKSSNILLDNEYEAQVSDFGLARLAMDAATHVTTRVMGTFGYLAPEYASSGKLTERSDVYSFGVVLLELITGRKPVDTSQPIGDESLVEWARPQLTHASETGEFASLIDPRLGANYNENEMFRMIETAAACIRHSAPMRPRMGLVARALEGLAGIDLSNGVKPGQSELYSAQSAEIRLFQRMAFGNQNYSSDFSNFSNFSNFSGKSQRN